MSSPGTLRRLTWGQVAHTPGRNDARSMGHIQVSFREYQPGRTTASSETNRISADRGVLAQTRMFRGARLRSATRAPSTRSRGPNLSHRNRTEQEQRLGRKKGRSMGALPKATDSHTENKRKLRDEVQGEKYWAASTATARTSKRETCNCG